MYTQDIHQLIENAHEIARKAQEIAATARMEAEEHRQAQEDHWHREAKRRESVLHVFEVRQEARLKRRKAQE